VSRSFDETQGWKLRETSWRGDWLKRLEEMDSLLQSLQWKVARFAQVEQRSYRTIACTRELRPQNSHRGVTTVAIFAW
jgi:hypothetical protein